MKTYVKPELYYESFELSQSIARCEWNFDMTLTDVNTCRAYYGGDDIPLFTDANGSCELTSTSDEYCYNKGSATYSTFNS